MLLKIAAASAVLALVPIAAQAQQSVAPPSNASTSSSNGALSQASRQPPNFDYYGIRRAAFLEATDRQHASSVQYARQVALAERLAPLVDEGQCAAAIEIAREENDRAVAYRVQRYCVEGQGMRNP